MDNKCELTFCIPRDVSSNTKVPTVLGLDPTHGTTRPTEESCGHEG